MKKMNDVSVLIKKSSWGLLCVLQKKCAGQVYLCFTEKMCMSSVFYYVEVASVFKIILN